MDPEDFFADVSWSAPTGQHCTFTPVERRPRLYLLGGSGKPSKLAALAAARKKDKENQLAADKPSSAVTLLDTLSTKESQPMTSMSTPQQATDQLKSPPSEQKEQKTLASLSLRNKTSSSPPTPLLAEATKESPESTPRAPPTATELGCGPSPFGAELSRTTQFKIHREAVACFRDSITLALFDTLNLPSQDAFNGPSPDAVVLQAQAKGVKLAA